MKKEDKIRRKRRLLKRKKNIVMWKPFPLPLKTHPFRHKSGSRSSKEVREGSAHREDNSTAGSKEYVSLYSVTMKQHLTVKDEELIDLSIKIRVLEDTRQRGHKAKRRSMKVPLS